MRNKIFRFRVYLSNLIVKYVIYPLLPKSVRQKAIDNEQIMWVDPGERNE